MNAHETYCPDGWKLDQRRGVDGVTLWRLFRDKPIRVKIPDFGEREMRFTPGDVTLHCGRWMGHSEYFGDRTPELATCREAVEWLLQDHELAVQAIRAQQLGTKMVLPLGRPAVLS